MSVINELHGSKVYKRDLAGMNSTQELYVDAESNRFLGIANIPSGAHVTKGFLPNGFLEGAIMPKGFLKTHGFIPKYINQQEDLNGYVIHGNHC